MSISLQNISKKYAQQLAVNKVSFEIPQGQVVGFLGPNGAGKTTTMKIITAFIPPSEGSVAVCGIDVVKNPIEAKRNIGYLPEHNPLYTDMYIKEFLAFAARSQGMKNNKSRIAEMIEATGLGPEQHKKINMLSKGYRQRVGLAQALIHDPKVLIFDEPTTGLDPNQIIEIRALLKNLGKDKTVLLSTHIMQEVQAVCDRVIIINEGNIVADASTDSLQQSQSGKVVYIAEFSKEVNLDLLKTFLGNVGLNKMPGNKIKIESKQNVDLREKIFKFAVDNNCTLLGMQKEEQNLEDVFRKLTKQSV